MSYPITWTQYFCELGATAQVIGIGLNTNNNCHVM